jgi:PAS domain S-box-containing protein
MYGHGQNMKQPKKTITSHKQIRRIAKSSPLKTSRITLENKIRKQTNELIIRIGQLRQGANRERLGADREKQGADREKRGAKREKLAEEQIYIRTKAMEATADGIFIIEAQKKNLSVMYANQSFYTMTGQLKKDIIGKDYFLHYAPDSDRRIIGEIKQTLRQGKTFQGEMLNSRKNGEKYWNLLRISPVRDDKGVVTHYIGIKTDVTVMRQRDLEIKEQREQLLHVTRVGKMAEFVSSLAHEISQPLTAILSYAQAAQRMLGDREPQLKEILQYIVNDDQRAAEVIRRLRSLLKKNEPEMKPVDINDLINETVLLITTDLNVRNNVMTVELDHKVSLINGDRIQLQQVLLNLISNSFDALEGVLDSREILIRTSRKKGGMLQVEVIDSGCGIPSENLTKLFSQFFTSKPDGLGMGLSISRSIIEAHGGRLDAANNLQRGANFYFTLPLLRKTNDS